MRIFFRWIFYEKEGEGASWLGLDLLENILDSNRSLVNNWVCLRWFQIQLRRAQRLFWSETLYFAPRAFSRYVWKPVRGSRDQNGRHVKNHHSQLVSHVQLDLLSSFEFFLQNAQQAVSFRHYCVPKVYFTLLYWSLANIWGPRPLLRLSYTNFPNGHTWRYE